MNAAVQALALRQCPGGILGHAEALAQLGVNGQSKTHLESHEQALAVIAQFQAVVPVGGQPAGQAVLAGAFQVEFQRAAQVAEDGGFTLVGVRQHFVIKIYRRRFRPHRRGWR